MYAIRLAYSTAFITTNLYTIVCSHEPDSISNVLEHREANLYLAGHSHNGSTNSSSSTE